MANAASTAVNTSVAAAITRRGLRSDISSARSSISRLPRPRNREAG
jgi:hypothetical protein